MKRYLITGASRGIGRAIAEKLAGPDITLLLHGRDTVALAKVCKKVKSRCAHVVRLIHDLAIPSGVSDLIAAVGNDPRSEEHTSELQSHHDLVCRLLLEKKK